MPELAKHITSTKTPQQFNRCRIYLKAITLLDLTNSTGKALYRYALNGEEHKERFSTHEWPNQHNLHPKYWHQWQTAIKEIFCQTGTHELDRKLVSAKVLLE